MGTLGKALGASGGYICGSRALIDYLVNRARSFIFSTAPVPAAAAAATRGHSNWFSRSEGEDRGETALVARRAIEFGTRKSLAFRSHSAIIPLIIGDETKAVERRGHVARSRHFHSRHPLSDRRARPGAVARDPDRRAHGGRCRQLAAALHRIANRKSQIVDPCIRSPNSTTNTSGIRSRRCATGCKREPIVIVSGRRRGAARRSRPRISRRQFLHLDQSARPQSSQNQRRHPPAA